MHEFGHVLGLGHVHQSNQLAKFLNKKATIEWMQEEYGLSAEDAEKKFRIDFEPYIEESIKDIGDFDAGSVMCYP